MSVRLSVIIVCHNDQDILQQTLEAVLGFLTSREYSSEVIISDGSSSGQACDATKRIVEDMSSVGVEVRYLKSEIGTQKGAVVTSGMLSARGEYRLFMDSDNATPVEQVDRLLADAQESDVVIASRYVDGASITPRRTLLRTLVSRGGNIWVGWLLGLHYKDTRCGFKFYSARAAEEVFSRVTLAGFGFDDEALVISRTLGLRVTETPVEWIDKEKLDGHPSQVRPADILNSFAEVMAVRRRERSGAYTNPRSDISLAARSGKR